MGQAAAGFERQRDAASDAEKLSGLIDDEATPDDDARILDRLCKDPELQSCWRMHHVVSEALRSDETAAFESTSVRASIFARLADEPPIVAPRRRVIRRVVVPGVALIAAFGAITVVALPMMSAQSTAGGANPRVATQQRDAGATAVAVRGPIKRDPRLENYLRAHREMTDSGVMPSAVTYLRVDAEDEQ